MNPHAVRAAEIESAFLAGAETNLNQARNRRLYGSRWGWSTRSQEEVLRARLVEAGRYDRELLRRMPKNTSRVLTGTVPRLLFGRRRTSVAIASVLAPVEQLLDEESGTPPPPLGLASLMAHVRELAAGADVPHLIGVCSPSGFTEEARRGGLEIPHVTLVLIEPRADGGWTALPGSLDATPADCKLFDPEATSQKIERVRQEIEARRADLVTGGLSATDIGSRLGLPARLVALSFEQVATADPELKISRQQGEVLLFRGAAARIEDSHMTMADWIKQLFSGEGDEARKINALSERRAQLVSRRDRLYGDLSKLETREGELLQQGRESASPSVKRRVAAQIKQLRDDMSRVQATARMLGQQVDVISTHIHNLSLIQQGQMARLPAPEEITADAVRAEEMLEQLNSEAELVTGLSMGTVAMGTDEEMAILAELEGPADLSEEPAAPTRAAPGRAPAERAQPPDRRKERGEPEAS